MAVNKNFVVKNGLEVATDVILANASTKNVGIGSTQPTLTLDVRGGIGATDLQVTGFSTFTDDIQVGASGSVFYVSNSTNMVGVGTSVPAYTLEVRGPVSTGVTALYVRGDMRVTGDINLDDITLDDASIDNLTVLDTLTVAGIVTLASSGGITTTGGQVYVDTDLNVGGASTFTGAADFNNDVDIDGHTELDNLNVSGFSTFVGFSTFNDYVFIQDGLNVAGVITATSFTGLGQIGVGSEGTFIGTGVTMVDFKSSNAGNTVDVTTGIATVTVQTGASIGLVIALGG
jgi:hypothetical protein|tara:strand:- start:53 stop:916 length:864 start_codon:yes stop_codon:yes gene_type:complete